MLKNCLKYARYLNIYSSNCVLESQRITVNHVTLTKEICM